MKRRYSISLGIGSLGSIAYLALLVWYVFGLVQDSDAGMSVITDDFRLLLHIGIVILAAVFTCTAFFSGLFPLALAACIAYTIAAVVFYRFLLFCTPLIILTIVGAVFCHKQQIKKREEEQAYEQKVHQEKKKQANKSYNQRQQAQTGNRRQILNQRFQQNQNAYLQGNPNYAVRNQGYVQPYQQPFYQPLSDPYAPLTQPLQPNTYPYPAYGNDPLLNQQAVQAPYDPSMVQQGAVVNQGNLNQTSGFYPQQNPAFQPLMQQGSTNTLNPMGFHPTGPAMNAPLQPQMGHTHSEGYFDDYGNFHPGKER